MKKNLLPLCLFLLLVLLSSCETVRYLAINNYEDEQPVEVRYTRAVPIFFNSDTLYSGPIGIDSFQTTVIRQNVDSTTYRFMAPAQSHTELQPKTLDPAITHITIAAGTDSAITIDLTNKKELKKLRKKRVVDTSGWFDFMIIVNTAHPKKAKQKAEAAEEQ